MLTNRKNGITEQSSSLSSTQLWQTACLVLLPVASQADEAGLQADSTALWQTGWFQVLALSLISLLLIGWSLGRMFMLKSRIRTLEEEVEKQSKAAELHSRSDGLTGLANRRWFEEMLDTESRRVCRDSCPISLVIVDIDYFRQYNDEYGHEAGDEVLRQVADELEGAIARPADLAARLGGEQIEPPKDETADTDESPGYGSPRYSGDRFALLLPGTDQPGARTIATRFQETLKDLRISHKRSEAAPFVTCSIGIATAQPTPETDPQDLFAAAREALDRAKQEGRNRLAMFSGSIT